MFLMVSSFERRLVHHLRQVFAFSIQLPVHCTSLFQFSGEGVDFGVAFGQCQLQAIGEICFGREFVAQRDDGRAQCGVIAFDWFEPAGL
jgi:hypothetical protein